MFQRECSATATTYPTATAPNRPPTDGLRAAIPAPIPIMAVNSGCANGESTPRSSRTASTLPTWPTPASSVNALPR